MSSSLRHHYVGKYYLAKKNYNIWNCLIQCRLIDCGLLSYVFHTYHIFNAKSSWWEMISRRGNSYFCVVCVLFSLFQFPSLWIFSGLKNKKASLEKKVSLCSGKCIGASRSALPPGKELFFLEHRKFLIEDAAADVIEGHEIEEEVEGVDSWLPNIHLRA